MFVPRQDSLRHEILELLLDMRDRFTEQVVSAEKVSITTEQLALQLHTTPEKIREACAKLVQNTEVKFDNFGKGECLYAWNNSYAAYADKKYIKEGRSFIIGRIRDYLSITVAFTAIISAVYTGCKAIYSEKNNKQEIEILRTEINKLKTQKQFQHQP